MAINWRLSFSQPAVQVLDSGTVKSNKDWAKLITDYYDLAVKTGLPAPPTPGVPFFNGNKQAMQRIIEKFLDFKDKKFLQDNIKQQRTVIKQYSNQVKFYKSVLSDAIKQISAMKLVYNSFGDLLKPITNELNSTVGQQKSTLQDSINAAQSLPALTYNQFKSKFNTRINGLRTFKLTIADLTSVDGIFSKIQAYTHQVQSLVQDMSAFNRTVNSLSIDNVSSIVTPRFEFHLPDSFSNLVLLRHAFAKVMKKIQLFIDRIKEKIRKIVEEKLVKVNGQIKKLTTKLTKVTGGDSKSSKFTALGKLLKSFTTSKNKEIRTIIKAYKELTTEMSSLAGRLLAIRARVQNLRRIINSNSGVVSQVLSTGESKDIFIFEKLLGPALAVKISKTPSLATPEVITEAMLLYSDLQALTQSREKIGKQKAAMQEKVNKLKAKIAPDVAKISKKYAKFNSFIDKVVLTRKELLAKKQIILSYKDQISTIQPQIIYLSQIVNGLHALSRSVNSTGPHYAKSKLKVDQISSSASQYFSKTGQLNLIKNFNVFLTEILNDLNSIDQLSQIGTNSSILNNKRVSVFVKIQKQIDRIFGPALAKIKAKKDKYLAAYKKKLEIFRTQQVNPLSVAMTNAYQRAVQAYWTGANWQSLTGPIAVVVPGTAFTLIKAKANSAQSTLIQELEKAFTVHSKSITGTFTNNSSGVTTPWIGYL